MKDFYYILGVDANCSLTEIREAYRKLSKKFHPDLNQHDKYFESQFKKIQQAYEILSDPFKRAKYDDELKGFETNPLSKKQKHQFSKTTVIDVAFTIILVIITFIFGDYVLKSINAPEKTKPQVIHAAITTAPIKFKSKHHKKRFIEKPQVIAVVPKTIKSVGSVKPVKPDTITPKPIRIAHVEPKPVKIISVNNNSLYSTMVKANITGVVNMREQDNLSSEIIIQIPNYSQVDVLERGERYYKVRYNNNTGYVPKWVLQTK